VLATALNRLGNHAEALPASSAALDIAASLLKSEGKTRKWIEAQAALGSQHGRALAGLGRHTEAVIAFEQSITVASTRVKVNATPDADAQRHTSEMRMQLSRSHQALGHTDLATSLALRATDELRSAAALSPAARDLAISLAEALIWQAQLDPTLAAALQAEARAAYDRAAALSPLKAEHAVARAALG